MATTTTNFGWDIPQSTDLVKDGATAIAALGQDIDTAMVDLKGGTTGQVLAKASGTDLDFSWVAQDDSNAIQNAIVDAKGDLIAATAADTPARLAVGTNGHVLTADSTAATGIKWAAPAGGGKILQVVQGTYATTVSSSSTSYVTTNLNATITPSSATSKILIHYSLLANNNADQTRTTIFRGTVGAGTNLASTNGFATAKNQNQASSSFLDSPSTTSATTYTIGGKVDSGTVYFFDGDTTGTIILMEVGA